MGRVASGAQSVCRRLGSGFFVGSGWKAVGAPRLPGSSLPRPLSLFFALAAQVRPPRWPGSRASEFFGVVRLGAPRLPGSALPPRPLGRLLWPGPSLTFAAGVLQCRLVSSLPPLLGLCSGPALLWLPSTGREVATSSECSRSAVLAPASARGFVSCGAASLCVGLPFAAGDPLPGRELVSAVCSFSL